MHFARYISPYKLMWIFALGGIVGWCVETLWCLMMYGVFESRSSFVLSPCNAVYGIGAVVLYLGLYKLRHRGTLFIFLAGALAGTAVEFLCSWVQEAVFGTVSWDYSALPFSIGGRVCLPYSVLWGALALAWVRWLCPALERLMLKIPNHWGRIIAVCLFCWLIMDTCLSAAVVGRWMHRQEGLTPATALGEWLDAKFPDVKMEKFYPNMTRVP